LDEAEITRAYQSVTGASRRMPRAE
jgi:hypothetical protein